MYRRLPAGKGPVDPKGVVEAQVPARRRRYDFFSRPVAPWLKKIGKFTIVRLATDFTRFDLLSSLTWPEVNGYFYSSGFGAFMIKSRIYPDNSATTRVDEPVLEAMVRFMREVYG